MDMAPSWKGGYADAGRRGQDAVPTQLGGGFGGGCEQVGHFVVVGICWGYVNWLAVAVVKCKDSKDRGWTEGNLYITTC